MFVAAADILRKIQIVIRKQNFSKITFPGEKKILIWQINVRTLDRLFFIFVFWLFLLLFFFETLFVVDRSRTGPLVNSRTIKLYKGRRKKSSLLSGPATKAFSPPPPPRLSGHRDFFPWIKCKKRTFFGASLRTWYQQSKKNAF